MRAGQLSTGADRQRGGESPVVLAEADRFPAEQDESADPVADRHRHGHRAVHVEVVRQEAKELLHRAVALAGEGPA